jgi:hypothetical protein
MADKYVPRTPEAQDLVAKATKARKDRNVLGVGSVVVGIPASAAGMAMVVGSDGMAAALAPEIVVPMVGAPLIGAALAHRKHSQAKALTEAAKAADGIGAVSPKSAEKIKEFNEDKRKADESRAKRDAEKAEKAAKKANKTSSLGLPVPHLAAAQMSAADAIRTTMAHAITSNNGATNEGARQLHKAAHGTTPGDHQLVKGQVQVQRNGKTFVQNRDVLSTYQSKA